MKCKICNNKVTLRSIAMHLKWNHNLKTDDYVKSYGEFRPKKLKEIEKKEKSSIKCFECNEIIPDYRNLMFHITKKHKNITQEEYIIKHHFDNIPPTCKCGCGQKTKFLRHSSDKWFTDYIKGHWDWVKPGYNYHSEETKKQMRISAIKRIENEKGLYKGVSKLEKELVSFIREYTDNISLNNNDILSGKEIDIYLPDLNLAIEFNGTYYHSDLFKKDKNYHLNKTKECNSKGINLIHIWDSDWIYKKDIIKSILKNKINNTDNRIYARNCVIKEVPRKESVLFLDKNHLQSSSISKYNIGLYYNEELVSLMTFSKLRKNLKQNNIEGHFELLRFCNKLNTNVVGGASKLFKYFINKYQPIKIISYANRDWSNGNLYEKLGMNPLSPTTPGYNWYKSKIKYNRFTFRKDILVKQGEDENLTEYEIMLSKGFYKVWNTGNLKFEYLR
jgi:hypothetical protein